MAKTRTIKKLTRAQKSQTKSHKNSACETAFADGSMYDKDKCLKFEKFYSNLGEVLVEPGDLFPQVQLLLQGLLQITLAAFQLFPETRRLEDTARHVLLS